MTVSGDYQYNGHRKYQTFMNTNGTMQGQNDLGGTDIGKWHIDNDGCLHVIWERYWDNWTGAAFKINNKIKFYDTQSGIWRTTFNKIVPNIQNLDL